MLRINFIWRTLIQFLCKANIRFDLYGLCGDKFVNYLRIKMLNKVNYKWRFNHGVRKWGKEIHKAFTGQVILLFINGLNYRFAVYILLKDFAFIM